ncbi:MAG: hypothetical protein NT143_04180 [Actinobacteria bacterium]|nr:hypothetical protein [Actinomycetota bacterium]
MPENSETSATTDAPPCEKCGAVTFATKRTMRTHDRDGASPIARDRKVPVWRCMRCTNEVAREA